MTDASKIIDSVRKQGRTVLTELEAKQAISTIGIGTTRTLLARSQKETAALSDDIGFPVVLKIASPDITHKTDAGGVKVGLKNKADVRRAYADIVSAAREKYPGAKIDGVTVQNVARPGIEIIIGTFKDPQFRAGHYVRTWRHLRRSLERRRFPDCPHFEAGCFGND